jgi:hypothetical protein
MRRRADLPNFQNLANRFQLTFNTLKIQTLDLHK